MAKPSIQWTLFAAGIGLVGIGAFLAWRQKSSLAGPQLRGLGKGRVVMGRHAMTPVVEEIKKNGMTLKHRRSDDMPIEERVANIQDMVWKGVVDPQMRKLALQITRKCPERDKTCEAREIYKAIKRRVRYTGDVAPVKIGGRNGPLEAVDLYQSPLRTWEFGGGDCDDHSGLAATLLSLNGIPARLRVTHECPGCEAGHIYGVFGMPVVNPKKWLAMDTTLPGDDKFAYEVDYDHHLDFPV